MTGMDPTGEPAIAALERLRDQTRAEGLRNWPIRVMVLEQAISAVREAYAFPADEDVKAWAEEHGYEYKPPTSMFDARSRSVRRRYAEQVRGQELSGLSADTFARFMARHEETARHYLGLIGYTPGDKPEDAHKETT